MARLVIGYCRVSTERQFTLGNALERYINALLVYGIPKELIFSDIESGISETREGFTQVLNLVRGGFVERVVIPNFDRLTRSPKQWEDVRELFLKHDCSIEFLENGVLDLESPDTIFTSRIQAALSAQVRDRVRKHSLDGHKRHREKKIPYKAVFGYLHVDDKLILNQNIFQNTGKTFATVAREIIEIFLKTTGLNPTLREIYKRYEVNKDVGLYGQRWLRPPFTHNGLKTWLTNPQLRGDLPYPKSNIVVPNNHEPLMTREEFVEVENIFKKNAKAKVGHNHETLKNPLTGFSFCVKCGGKMSTFTSWNGNRTKRTNYVVCRTANTKFGLCDQKQSKGLTVEKAEKILLDALMERIDSIADWANVPLIDTEINPEVLELTEQIKKLKMLDDPDVEEIILKKESKLFELLSQKVPDSSDNFEEYKLAIINSHFWLESTPHQRNLVYRELVEKVWVLDGQVVEIQFSPQLYRT